jgi:hypothetical protein
VIQVQTPTGTVKYNTEDTVLNNAMEHLSKQFQLAYLAPIYSTQILDNIGHLGDTQSSQDILDGIYGNPSDADQWTMKILQEAHILYQLLSNESIDVYDFQDY